MIDYLKQLPHSSIRDERLKGAFMSVYFRWIFIFLISLTISVQLFAGYTAESIHSFILMGIYFLSNIVLWYAARSKYDPPYLGYISAILDVGIVSFHLYYLALNHDALAVTAAATTFLFPIIFLLYTFRLNRPLLLFLIIISVASFNILYFFYWFQNPLNYEGSLSLSPLSHMFKSVYILFIGLLCIYLQHSMSKFIFNNLREVSKQAELDAKIKIEEEKNSFAEEMIKKEKLLNKSLEKEIFEKEAIAEKLKNSREQLHGILTNIPGAAYRCLFDENFTVIYYSEKIEDIAGYQASDLIDNSKIAFASIIHPDDLQDCFAKIREACNLQIPYEFEYRIIHKDGSIVWVKENGQCMPDEDGGVLYLDGIITDITEKKSAEKSLKETQEIVNSLISNLSGAASRCLYDEHLTVKYYSDKIYDITGYSANDFIDNKTLPFVDIIFKEDLDRIKQNIDKAIENKTNYSIEFRITHKNGEIRWVNENGQPVLDSMGNVLFLDGITYDITYKKKVESALKSTEKKYQKIIETSPVPMSFANLNDEIEYVNQAFVSTFGYNIDEIPDLETYREKLYPDKEYRERIYPDWNKTIEMAAKHRVPIKPFDVKMTCKNGDVKNIVIHSAVLDDGIFVVFNDVTDIKSANTAIQESERKYRELMDFLPQTIYELDTQGNLMFCNKIGRNIFGIDEDLEKEKVYAFKFFIPEDKDRMIQMAQKRHSGQISNDYNEYTALDKNGDHFPVIIYASPLFKDDEIIGSRGIILDITKLKSAEESLVKAKRELEDLNTGLENEIQERTKQLTRANTQLLKLQKENLQSQFEVLKQQVNPHFLFNSLNVLTSLIKIEPDLAETFTERLSKVYRYVLENKEKDMVPLITEIEFLNSYLFLIEIRFMNKILVNINIDKKYYEYNILPIAIQLIIENAIKHNTFSKLEPLSIDVFVDEKMNLNIVNNLKLRETKFASTGVGLENISRRYALVSDQKPEFVKTEKEFVARLPLLKAERIVE